jgi:hypothetical protein
MLPYWNFGNDAFVEAVWPDSVELDPNVYETLFLTANSLCRAYAPSLADDAPVSESYRLAEVITARDIASKMAGGNSQSMGMDEQEMPVFPLIFLARDLLRPKTNPITRLR